MTSSGDTLFASEPITLVYVLSTGRSGSTLLEMLLASEEGAWTTGEVHLLPFEVEEGGYHCGCGQLTTECQFWKPVIDKLNFEKDGVKLTKFREAHNRGKTWRAGLLAAMLFKASPGQSSKSQTYADLNFKLFEAVSNRAEEVSGTRPKWIVDASKDPYRLYWLLNDPRLDVRVIHLARGAHGFVNSSLKRERLKNPVLKLIEIVRLAFRWASSNLIFRLVCAQMNPAHSTRIAYESLATEPGQTLKSACQEIGVPISAAPERLQEKENHAIAGNQMRSGKREVVLDEKWRREMGPLEKVAVSFICALPSSIVFQRKQS